VVSGDTLTSIAGRIWGAADAVNWPWLWYSNKTAVPDPSVIHIGTVLTEPADPPVPGWLQTAADAAMGSSQPAAYVSYSSPQPSGGSVSTAGMAAFEACVIARESGGNPTAYNPSSGASGLFQFLASTWDNYGGYSEARYAPVSVQEAYFAIEYAADGTSPWAPYDGC
jgi:hypothetical protein